MKWFRCVLAYDGSGFAGWQRQPGQRTVEGAVAEALEKIFGHPVDISAASRTDAGVHALGQVIGFGVETRLAPELVLRALNSRLPEDVCATVVEETFPGFDPRRHSYGKRYRYWIGDGPGWSPFLRHYQWQWKRGRLDCHAMQEAARLLLGTHDFACFQNTGSPRSSTTRTLYQVIVERVEPSRFSENVPPQKGRVGEGFWSWNRAEGREDLGAEAFLSQLWCRGGVFILVEGDGFLYNMVRSIVGTLVEVGRGARRPEWVGQVLASRDRRQAGPTAPPWGLYLEKVFCCDSIDGGITVPASGTTQLPPLSTE
ncbi:MAG: tRNA pseudouridine synthase A [Thermoguttaceae bacterium]|nr:tRNA pseudouridine synthase A [Thermoguttaceae bacterium]MDW8078821.1 tRNA pseudouridine synthase A [Thermoguttaceae bacterium]